MEIKVQKVGNDGEGIAFYKKKPVYIYYAYKGEIVDIDLFTNKRGVYEGNLIKVIEPSIHRVEPRCPYYGKVGASNLMHLSYNEQLNYKKELIHYHMNINFRREARKIPIYLPIKAKNIFNYRNKIDMPIKNIGSKNQMGLFERGTNKFIPIKSYVLHETILDDAINQVLSLMDKYQINAYNNKTKRGAITHLSLRTNEKKEIQLTFIVNKEINLLPVVEDIVKINKNIVSIYYSFVPRLSNNRDLFSNKLVKLYGDEYLKMTLNNNLFLLAPNTFFQLNTSQAKTMFELIIKRANFKKNDVVLDAYSGVGPIATFVSPHVKEVVAIERVGKAINALKEANKINNIKNIKALTGDVINTVKYIKKKFDVMIFDPPREGLKKELLNFILKEKPKKIIYASCNPETLAKDLKVLSSVYQVKSITPIDMFPQTSHTESVTVLDLI